jgi:hypothetical protein
MLALHVGFKYHGATTGLTSYSGSGARQFQTTRIRGSLTGQLRRRARFNPRMAFVQIPGMP